MLKFPRFVCLSWLWLCVQTQRQTPGRLCYAGYAKSDKTFLEKKTQLFNFKRLYLLLKSLPFSIYTCIYHMYSGAQQCFRELLIYCLTKLQRCLHCAVFFSRCRHEQWTTDRKCGLTEGLWHATHWSLAQAELEPVTLWFRATILRTSLSDQHVLACGPQTLTLIRPLTDQNTEHNILLWQRLCFVTRCTVVLLETDTNNLGHFNAILVDCFSVVVLTLLLSFLWHIKEKVRQTTGFRCCTIFIFGLTHKHLVLKSL